MDDVILSFKDKAGLNSFEIIERIVHTRGFGELVCYDFMTSFVYTTSFCCLMVHKFYSGRLHISLLIHILITSTKGERCHHASNQ